MTLLELKQKYSNKEISFTDALIFAYSRYDAIDQNWEAGTTTFKDSDSNIVVFDSVNQELITRSNSEYDFILVNVDGIIENSGE